LRALPSLNIDTIFLFFFFPVIPGRYDGEKKNRMPVPAVSFSEMPSQI
jgi:hypothetical protein